MPEAKDVKPTHTRIIMFYMEQEGKLAWMRDFTGLGVNALVRQAVDQLYEKMTEIADEAETQPTTN